MSNMKVEECVNCGRIQPKREMYYHEDLEMYFCDETCEREYIAENIQEHEC
jgi:hypothetical protein